MKSRERILTALQHREADRVPFDLGGTVDTGIHKDAYGNLLHHLGKRGKEVHFCEMIQQLSAIDEDVALELNIDTRGVMLGAAADLFYRNIQTERQHQSFEDPFGVKWAKPVKGGLYFDIRAHPISGRVRLDEIENYPWPELANPILIETMRDEAERISRDTDAAIVLAAGDAGIFERAQWVRGFTSFLTDLIIKPSLATSVLDIITDMHIRYWDRALDAMGDLVQVVVEADDLGMQDRPLISPELYRRHIKPRHKRLFSFIKEKAPNVYIFFHCCGSIYDLIPDLVDAGIDILNPVQVSAAKMDTKRLKREFGSALTFWGGGVDTQRILPQGTPMEVKNEVRKRLDDLSPGGGYVFSSIHNIQPDVPPRNIMAMVEALREYGRY